MLKSIQKGYIVVWLSCREATQEETIYRSDTNEISKAESRRPQSNEAQES